MTAPRPEVPKDRIARLADANELLVAIASMGLRFFHHKGRVSRFELGSGRLWFWDSYSKRRISMHQAAGVDWNRQGFTQGGTMRRLVEDLKEYIWRGTPIRRNHLGPWPEWVCGGDPWAYGPEAMQSIRDAAKRLGVTQ